MSEERSTLVYSSFPVKGAFHLKQTKKQRKQKNNGRKQLLDAQIREV